MSVRRSVVIVAGLIAAVGCASRDVEVRTAGPNDGSAEVTPGEKSVAEFFAMLSEFGYRGIVVDASPIDVGMIERYVGRSYERQVVVGGFSRSR